MAAARPPVPTASMKTLCFLAALAAVPLLSGAVGVGRGEITLGVTAAATYDSNPGGQRDADDDIYGTLTPQLGYTRRAGRIEAEAAASLAIVRFAEQTASDAENASLSATLRLAGAASPKTSASLRGAYTETTDVNADLNARLRAANTSVTAEAAWIAGPRMNFGLTGTYLDSVNDGASDAETVTAGATYGYRDFFYGNSLFSGYTFQSVRSSGENARGAALDQTSHEASAGLGRPLFRDVYGRFGAGYRILERSRAETAAGDDRSAGMTLQASVDGPFLPRRYFPKVKSRASLSYADAATPGIDDPGTKHFGADVSIVWDAGPHTVVSLGVDRSQRLSVLDYTVLSTGARLTLSQRLRHNLDGSFTASHNRESFRGLVRSDRRTGVQAELTYALRAHWRATLSYRLDTVNSNAGSASYDRQLVSATVGWSL